MPLYLIVADPPRVALTYCILPARTSERRRLCVSAAALMQHVQMADFMAHVPERGRRVADKGRHWTFPGLSAWDWRWGVVWREDHCGGPEACV